MKRSSLILVAACLSASGCATAPAGALVISSLGELPPIQQEKAELLARVSPGMTLPDFREAAPEAYLVGQNDDVTAYEISKIQTYVTRNDISRQNIIWGFGSPTERTFKQAIWFYFIDEKLEKWGEPDQWPSRQHAASAPPRAASRR